MTDNWTDDFNKKPTETKAKVGAIPIIIADKDFNKELDRIFDRILGRHSIHFNYSKAEIREELSTLIKSIVPEKKSRKPDEEYMYCITCNQIIDTLDADCFCSIHNLVVDKILSKLEGTE